MFEYNCIMVGRFNPRAASNLFMIYEKRCKIVCLSQFTQNQSVYTLLVKIKVHPNPRFYAKSSKTQI